jgi:arylamine N-acetyltransferase
MPERIAKALDLMDDALTAYERAWVDDNGFGATWALAPIRQALEEILSAHHEATRSKR